MKKLVAHDPEEVIEMIRNRLRENGQTQRTMAAHLGFTTKHMSQLLTGKATISVPLLFRMLDYIRVEVRLTTTRRNRND
jgi:plasmid maintenance system antidote protein VapI